VTSEGSALTRFRRALKVGNGPAAYAAATELPRVELADALALTLLLASEQGNLFDKACARWIGRFALEVPGLPADGCSSRSRRWWLYAMGHAAGLTALAELFKELGWSKSGGGNRALAHGSFPFEGGTDA
jgi:hypothetical protein